MLIRILGGLDVVVGIISLIVLLNFYSSVTTFFLFLPSLVLIANGIVLIAVSYYVGGPSVKTPVVLRERENIFVEDMKEQAGYSFKGTETSEVRHEYIGMEVYDRWGNYYGRVTDVVLDNYGGLIEFYTVRGKNKSKFRANEIEKVDDVILLGIG
ncbi:MAG TPA: PRC-barrel domain containing protein [Euryarchaeota archaeon]|nr:PRC-barrel domain protein [archaeon BMS3Bbin15]HDL14694.1 PRC-barrel domain containing protein [Euryarchaeota archaeon]